MLATADETDICTTGLCTFITPSLRTGRYTIKVSAVDKAGNQGPFTPALGFRAGRLDVVQGLAGVDPSTVISNVPFFIVPNPKFQWRPPVLLPNSGDLLRGGIDTYMVAITGDIQGSPFTIVPATSFTNPQFFQVDCSRSTGDGTETATGNACKRFIGSGDIIQITVTATVPDGTHQIGVRVLSTTQVSGPRRQPTSPWTQ